MAEQIVKYAGRGSAKGVIGDITHGFRIFMINKGQFSLLDVIRELVRQTGPADLAVTCWAAGLEDIKTLNRMVLSKEIRSLRWLVGSGMVGTFQSRYSEELLRFGETYVRTNRVHMKTALISTDDWKIAVRGSANLNSNKRFEQFDISDEPEVYGAIESVINEMWESSPPGLDIPPRIRERAFRRAMILRDDG